MKVLVSYQVILIHDDTYHNHVLRGQLHRRANEPPREHPATAYGQVLLQRPAALHSAHHPAAFDDGGQDVRLDEHL